MQVILNKKEKEELVIKLYQNGKPVREIAQQAHLSFGTIEKIIRRINGLDNDEIISNDMRGKSKSAQAMNLFLHDKRPVEVVVVAAMAVMLIGATAFATDSVFADGKKKYGKNQAIGQTNACGNGKLPMYVFCQNTGSQVQGEDNAVALDSVQKSGDDRKDKKDWDHGDDGGHGGNGGNGDYEEDW